MHERDSYFPHDDGNDSISLSFCIPTLNRADKLRKSLESIVKQQLSGIEIIVVDGGSTDNTLEVIDSFRDRFHWIQVYTSESKSGVDRDILQSVRLAKGQYCWLFSDDDFIIEGALSKVIQTLRSHPDISGLSTNYTAYDSNLEYTIATAPAIAHRKIRESFLFKNRDDCFTALGVHLGFLSCQVVNRAAWLRVAESEDLSPQCNAWIIVYMIGKMLEQHPTWYYIHDSCVGYRSDNDSFIARLGVIKRQEITHIHYAHTIGSLFPQDSLTYRSVFQILLIDRMPRTLAVLKAKDISVSTQHILFKTYFNNYYTYPAFWYRVLPIFFFPNVFFKVLKHIYSASRKRKASN